MASMQDSRNERELVEAAPLPVVKNGTTESVPAVGWRERPITNVLLGIGWAAFLGAGWEMIQNSEYLVAELAFTLSAVAYFGQIWLAKVKASWKLLAGIVGILLFGFCFIDAVLIKADKPWSNFSGRATVKVAQAPSQPQAAPPARVPAPLPENTRTEKSKRMATGIPIRIDKGWYGAGLDQTPVALPPGSIVPLIFRAGPIFIVNLSKSRDLILDFSMVFVDKKAKRNSVGFNCHDDMREVKAGRVPTEDAKGAPYLFPPIRVTKGDATRGVLACIYSSPYPPPPADISTMQFEITDVATGRSIMFDPSIGYQGNADD
jgi:hypothetical protein